MKRIASFSVKYPVTVLMIMLAVVLLGSISFNKLGMDLFPDLNNPRLYISITAGDRPPEELEQQFIEQIEALSIRQSGATGVSSVCRTGTAEVTVEYAWDTDMDRALLDLQKTLNSYSQSQDIDELTISQLDPNATPILLVGFSNPEIDDMDELRRTAESYLRNELIRLEGIADVRLVGQEEKQVIIETNDYLLEAYGVTTSDISSKINDHNRTISGGSIVEMGLQYIIKGVAELTSMADIENIIITYKNPETATGVAAAGVGDRLPVYLKDLASVRLENKQPDTIARLNGERCIALEIYKETRYNTVRTVDTFFEQLATLQKALPGYELTVIRNSGEFITDAVNEVQQTALIGVVLAIIVLFVFLRRIGTTAIVSVAIPVSVIATFNLMYFKGLTLNIMTLGGLALGAGMLVDNAIVVMENIFRHIENGMSIREAAVEGAGQVGGAITAATLTTIIVFLPIVYLHGSAGELFRDQAWTVAFSLLSSLGVALLVIPMLSVAFLKHSGTRRIRPTAKKTFPWYRSFLGGLLKARWLVILLAIAATAGAAMLIPVIGSEFMPQTDSHEFTVSLTFPQGTELRRTDEAVRSLEAQLEEIFGEDLATCYSISGSLEAAEQFGESTVGEEHTASLYLVFAPETELSMSAAAAAMNSLFETIPDLDAQVFQEQAALELTLGSETAPFVVDIYGDDLDTIQSLTDEAMVKLAEVPGLINIESSFGAGRPEVNIVLDRLSAGMLNIGLSQVSSALSQKLEGVSAGQWEHDSEMRDLTIELPDVGIASLGDIMISSGGQEIPLSDIARIEVSEAPIELIRTNQSRVGRITAHLADDRPLDQVVTDISERLDTLTFPSRYGYRIGGEEQERREAFSSLKFALLLSLVLVYMVLASQFESLLHPFMVILSIPLAGVGAVLLFFILGMPLNIMALIGIIMLAGIAVNDAIILVDTINRHRRSGLGTTEAILNAGEQRIRPIVMTSLTTILALLPLTFGFGEGAALRAPMALAVIGGLITSTILTLIVIPCIYAVLDRFVPIAETHHETDTELV